MSAIDATELRRRFFYDPETGQFTRKTVPKNIREDRPVGHIKTTGYVAIEIDDRQYPAHRLAWLYVHGVWPKGDIDHINRVRADNRLSNLREGAGTFETRRWTRKPSQMPKQSANARLQSAWPSKRGDK